MENNEIKRKYCKINLLFFVCLLIYIYEEAEKKVIDKINLISIFITNLKLLTLKFKSFFWYFAF